MPDPADAFSTLDDFLLSLADGVTHAQAQLARAAVSGPPGQTIAYHLPRVDFELRMSLRVVQDSQLSARYRALRPERAGDTHLLFKPLASESADSALEIAAVVRGAFVATPANEGLPRPVLTTRVSVPAPRAPVVHVLARSGSGEPLAGLEVQLNVDREESIALSAASGVTLVVDPATSFERGVVITDADGAASVALNVPATQKPGLLVLVIDAASRTETLVYEVQP